METYRQLVQAQIDEALAPIKARLAQLEASSSGNPDYLMALVAARLLKTNDPSLPTANVSQTDTNSAESDTPPPDSADANSIGGVVQTEVKS